MKYRIRKQIDAIRATSEQAKIDHGLDVKNLTHETDGYIVGNKWVPKKIFEDQAIPYETDTDILDYFLKDIARHSSWLQNSYLQKHHSLTAQDAVQALNEYKTHIMHLKTIAKKYDKRRISRKL